MNTTEHLLTCLLEEAAEIQQAVSKAMRFGLDDGNPNRNTTNADDIALEIVDLLAVVVLLQEQGILKEPKDIDILLKAKRDRVTKYMVYAQNTGALSE
ncbi:hypothetical protein GC175_31180 [bacterium]|nr:hypothetical protein [bacterium]